MRSGVGENATDRDPDPARPAAPKPLIHSVGGTHAPATHAAETLTLVLSAIRKAVGGSTGAGGSAGAAMLLSCGAAAAGSVGGSGTLAEDKHSPELGPRPRRLFWSGGDWPVPGIVWPVLEVVNGAGKDSMHPDSIGRAEIDSFDAAPKGVAELVSS